MYDWSWDTYESVAAWLSAKPWRSAVATVAVVAVALGVLGYIGYARWNRGEDCKDHGGTPIYRKYGVTCTWSSDDHA
jgi:uncharacterized membrane protein YebE (DUF533 family)